MLTSSTQQRLKKKLVQYEGNIPHMYLDANGFVTVGVGHLIETTEEAEKLPFIQKSTKKQATDKENGKLALFDMIFNLGMTNLKNRWPNFNKHIKRRDWQKAATECKRKPPVSASRNQYVRDLLQKAEKKASSTGGQ